MYRFDFGPRQDERGGGGGGGGDGGGLWALMPLYIMQPCAFKQDVFIAVWDTRSPCAVCTESR